MMRLAVPAASAALPLALAVVASMLLDWPPGGRPETCAPEPATPAAAATH